MRTRQTRRAAGRAAASVAALLALAAAGGVLLSGCKSGADRQGEGAGVSAAARSPKELALAGFLKAMKLEGRPVLIEFGLVGCKLSEEGLDGMLALQEANAVPGLAMVRVEGNQDAAAVDKYFKAKAPSFAVYRDGRSELAKALSATAYPTFMLVDRFGHIRYEGSYPSENLVSWGQALASEKQDPGDRAARFGVKELDVAKLLAAKLPDLKDRVKPLSDYMGGKGLVLLFVDTTCPFCAIALKEMPAVAESLAKQKINALVVNGDDAKDEVLEFYAKNDPGAAVVYDTGPSTREQWNVHSVPIAVYISPAGTIGYQGEAVWANLGAAIDKSLGSPAKATTFEPAGTGFG